MKYYTIPYATYWFDLEMNGMRYTFKVEMYERIDD